MTVNYTLSNNYTSSIMFCQSKNIFTSINPSPRSQRISLTSEISAMISITVLILVFGDKMPLVSCF